MSFSDALQSFITGQAQKQLAPYSAITGGGSMGLGYSASVSASSSASSGPSKSGDISGGTAFNIGGINLGTQYQSPVDAQGGNPAQSVVGSVFGNYTPYLIIGGAVIAALILLRR